MGVVDNGNQGETTIGTKGPSSGASWRSECDHTLYTRITSVHLPSGISTQTFQVKYVGDVGSA